MRTYVTTEEMKNLDRFTIEEKGIEGRILMENAGRGIVDALRKDYGDLSGDTVLILCGPGNNGGDGFVMARWMRFFGADVHVALVDFDGPKSEDAKFHFDILEKIPVDHFVIKSDEDFAPFVEALELSDIVVDAMFGTGLTRNLEGVFDEVVKRVNQSDALIVSVDLPSGLHSDTGEVLGNVVLPDYTYTLAFAKVGLLHGKALDLCGELNVVDIGISEEWFDELDIPIRRETLVNDLLPYLLPRSQVVHKGDFGHLCILAGSAEKSGAAVLAVQAALHSGVGLATLACPKSAHTVIKSQISEAMSIPLRDQDGTLDEGILTEFLKELSGKSALVMGPGLKAQSALVAFCESVLEKTDIPIVLDADALNSIAAEKKKDWDFKGRAILTPHPGEMARLMGMATEDIQKDRLGTATDLAKRWKAYVLLKGSHSILAAPDGEVVINPTGNPKMASGGMGDVLSGMIGASLAKGLSPMMAMVSSAYLHGLAADFLSDEENHASLLASEVSRAIPRVVAALQGLEFGEGEG